MINRTCHPRCSRKETRSRKPTTIVLIVGLIAVLFVGALAGSTPTLARKKKPTSWTRTHRLAPGVTYTQIKDIKGPYRIHIVSIKLAKASTLDTVLANDTLPGLERTSDMARRSDALVAINGDYAQSSGRPTHTFAVDGGLSQTPLMWGRNFSVDRSESQAYIGHPQTRAWMYEPGSDLELAIERVNAGAPTASELALFTSAGGGEEMPPEVACSARLMQATAATPRGDHGVEADFEVDQVLCGPKRLWLKGGVVVSTPAEGKRVTEITSLIPGEVVSLGWTLGWAGVLDTIGGNPTMIEDGQIIDENVSGTGSFFVRHPRTGVGSTADGRVLFVTVDGRQPGYSIGMTLERFARLFKNLGARWALNLDGGGSTTMVVKGKIKNRPSDGSERAVSSALVLLRGQDAGESPGSFGATSAPSPAAASTSFAWQQIVADGASTGGLADALVRKGVPLPPSMRKAAATFRSMRARSHQHTSP